MIRIDNEIFPEVSKNAVIWADVEFGNIVVVNKSDSFGLSEESLTGHSELKGALDSADTEIHEREADNGDHGEDCEGKHDFYDSVAAFGFHSGCSFHG